MANKTYSVNISGANSGQIAVGEHIEQQQSAGTAETDASVESLKALIDGLRAQIERSAPPEKKDLALGLVNEVKAEVDKPEPDVSTLTLARNWLLKNLPGIAGAVTSTFVHPILGKLVGTLGDAAATGLGRVLADGKKT